jgi:hypothetical protein
VAGEGLISNSQGHGARNLGRDGLTITQPCTSFLHVLRQGHSNLFGLAADEKKLVLSRCVKPAHCFCSKVVRQVVAPERSQTKSSRSPRKDSGEQ